jgi:hypothetical protein
MLVKKMLVYKKVTGFLKRPLTEAKNRPIRWAWVILSLVACFVISSEYVTLYRQLTDVRLFFQTKDKDRKTIYFQNIPINWIAYGDRLSDFSRLYYSSCEIVEDHGCRDDNNWIGVQTSFLGCSQVKGCNKPSAQLTIGLRLQSLREITDETGNKADLRKKERARILKDFNSPLTWGEFAGVPIFLICLIFSFNLGRSFMDFVFG